MKAEARARLFSSPQNCAARLSSFVSNHGAIRAHASRWRLKPLLSLTNMQRNRRHYRRSTGECPARRHQDAGRAQGSNVVQQANNRARLTSRSPMHDAEALLASLDALRAAITILDSRG